jgi:hypothetical protein
MNEQTQTPAADSVQTPAASLADMSLAEYRAQREKSAATPEEKQPATGEPNKPAAVQPVENRRDGESAAEEGAADETTEQSGEAAGDEKPKKKGGFQRKIEAKDREIEELKRQLAEKSAAPAAESKKQDAQPAPELPKFDKPKPKLEDFDSIEAFTDALTDWKADERDWKRTQAEQQAKQQQEANTILDRWNQRKTEVQKQHADYDEVLEEVSDVKLTPAHQRIFLESEHGPELAYQLAQDREALESFAQLSPLKAAAYLGKLEASLTVENAPEPETKVSNAPRPIKPVGSSRTSGTPDVSKMSLADWRKARESGKIR